MCFAFDVYREHPLCCVTWVLSAYFRQEERLDLLFFCAVAGAWMESHYTGKDIKLEWSDKMVNAERLGSIPKFV